MAMKSSLILLVIGLTYACNVEAQCTLARGYLEAHPNYLFTGSKNGKFRLLLNQVIPDGAMLYITCNKQLLSQHLCNGDTLSGSLSTEPCRTPPMTVVVAEDLTNRNVDANVRGFIAASDLAEMRRVKIYDNQKIIDLQNEGRPYTLFRVGFEDNHGFMDLYRSLYNNIICVPILTFAKFQTYPFDPTLKNDRPSYWRTDGIGACQAVHEAFFKRNYVHVIERLVSESDQRLLQINVKSDNVLGRGHLAANADFMFRFHRHATFNLINAVPQFSRINQCDWNDVEVYIYNQAYTEVTIVTGILNDVVSLQETKIYLHDRFLPVPMWIYKVVLKDVGDPLVFLSYNNIFEQQIRAVFSRGYYCPAYMALKDNERPKPPCIEVPCPCDLRRKGDGRFIYCCNAYEFLRTTGILTSFYMKTI